MTRCLSPFAPLLALVILTGGCGGKSGETVVPSVVHSVVLSNVDLWPASAGQDEGGGSIAATFFLDFSDPDGDLTILHVSDGDLQQDLLLDGVAGLRTGTIKGTLQVPTTVLGPRQLRLQLIDGKGNRSGTAAVTFSVTTRATAFPGAPILADLTPGTVVAGSPGFTLSVSGWNFFAGSQVYWNGSPRATTLASAGILGAAITTGDLATPGTAQVSVVNPASEGGSSTSLPFTITPPPAPAVGPLFPSSAVSGGSAFTLLVAGTKIFPDSVVHWDGAPRPTTYVGPSYLRATIAAEDIAVAGTAQVSVVNPASEGGPSIAVPFTITPAPPPPLVSASLVGTITNDVVYDPVGGRLYASVPSRAGAGGNSILVIDPASGSVLDTVFAGSEPDRLALSDDGQYLYVGVDGSYSVQRFLLPGLVPDISIPLGSSKSFGGYIAVDLQVAPGAPHTVAVTLNTVPATPGTVGGVVVFDDVVARAATAAGWQLYCGSLAWGASASTLSCASGASGGYVNDLYTFGVDAGGVTLVGDRAGVFNTYSATIHYQPTDGLLHADTGQVIDPSTGLQVALFSAAGPMAMAPALNSAYFLSMDNSRNPVLKVFSLDHYLPVATEPIILPTGTSWITPRRLLFVAPGKLASGGNGGPVILFSGTPLSTPSARELGPPSAY